MHPTRKLLGLAIVVLGLGAFSVISLVNLQEGSARTSIGIALGTAATGTSIAFVLTFMLQSTLTRNSLHLTLNLTKDLSLFDFQNVRLARVTFRGKRCVGANFAGARLRGANFAGCDLRGADFSGADVRRADFRGADLRAAQFQEARLEHARLWDAQLSGADFRAARLSQTALINVTAMPLEDDEIDEIYRIGAQVHSVYSPRRVKVNAHYRTTWFVKADLTGADLTGARLNRCDFDRADLAFADFSNGQSRLSHRQSWKRVYSARHRLSDLRLGGYLGHNSLAEGPADLSECNFASADLRGANLDGAIFTQIPSERTIAYCVGEPIVRSSHTIDHRAPPGVEETNDGG